MLNLIDIGFNDEIEENGLTFYENALIKAKTVSEFLISKNLKYDVISDDSGLCVNALDGKPGVYSARYSGLDCNNSKNKKLLLKNMENIKDRKAFYQCNIIVYKIDGTYKSYEGKTYGFITNKEKGNLGFGYDSIFQSNDLGVTFAEADEDSVNKISHRYRAIENMLNDEE